jgi:hypothetical protein
LRASRDDRIVKREFPATLRTFDPNNPIGDKPADSGYDLNLALAREAG